MNKHINSLMRLIFIIPLIFSTCAAPEEIPTIKEWPGTLTFAGGPTMGDREIWTTPMKDTDGAGFSNLLYQPYDNQNCPRWSPDGTRILYISEETNSSNLLESSINIMNADGSDKEKLYAATEWSIENLSWNPNGNQIAFDNLYDIYVMDFDGSTLSNLQNITQTENSGSMNFTWEDRPDWSPDGNSILYHFVERSNEIDTEGLMIHSLTNDSKTVLTCGSQYGDMRWSPDGSEIAYTISAQDDTPLYLINVDGSNERRMTETGDLTGFAWSPGGDHITYALEYWENHATHTDLRVLDLNSGSVTAFFTGNQWYFYDLDWTE